MDREKLQKMITDKLIEGLEKGNIPWKKEWSIQRYKKYNSNLAAVEHTTGRPYHGINMMLLEPGEYVTFNKIRKLKAKLNKGSKAQRVFFWKQIKVKDEETDPITGKIKEPAVIIPFLRFYSVFNIKDTDLEQKWGGYEQPELFNTKEKLDKAQTKVNELLNNYLGHFKIGYKELAQNRAFYKPISDEIVLPTYEQFENNIAYLKTKTHEIMHSTGHSSRLNRDFGGSFGNLKYSFEELVAEVGTTMFCSYHLGINNIKIDNSQAYINGWAKYLKAHPDKITSAFSKAKKASAFLDNFKKEV